MDIAARRAEALAFLANPASTPSQRATAERFLAQHGAG